MVMLCQQGVNLIVACLLLLRPTALRSFDFRTFKGTIPRPPRRTAIIGLRRVLGSRKEVISRVLSTSTPIDAFGEEY